MQKRQKEKTTEMADEIVWFRIGGCICLDCYIDIAGNQVCFPCGTQRPPTIS